MTVAAVAERAGVSRATAYRYFVSNDAVTVWATRPVSIQADAPEVPAPTQAQAPGERAARLVQDHAIWAFEHERELRAVLALSLAPDAEERDLSLTWTMKLVTWFWTRSGSARWVTRPWRRVARSRILGGTPSSTSEIRNEPAAVIPMVTSRIRNRPTEKRKVDSSILSLTTTSRTISQPCYLRRQQEDRDSHGAVSAHR